MIVVVGSRHDAVATHLLEQWPESALCSAEDLIHKGWVWPNTNCFRRTWVIQGRLVPDAEVSGVFLRRSTVYAEELTGISHSDRRFIAAETEAFLTFILATTSARVVNPVVEGSFGEETLRRARWGATAINIGLDLYPIRVDSSTGRHAKPPMYTLEVVGNNIFGKAPVQILEKAGRLITTLGIPWGVLFFDAKHRLMGISGSREPSTAATATLGRMLSEKQQ